MTKAEAKKIVTRTEKLGNNIRFLHPHDREEYEAAKEKLGQLKRGFMQTNMS